MRDIASSYLTKDYPARVEFTHSLLEGFLTHKGSAIFGSFSGPRFHADFGTHRDAPWNCEFILPTHSVRALIDEDTVLFRGEFENGKLVESLSGSISPRAGRQREISYDLSRATKWPGFSLSL